MKIRVAPSVTLAAGFLAVAAGLPCAAQAQIVRTIAAASQPSRVSAQPRTISLAGGRKLTLSQTKVGARTLTSFAYGAGDAFTETQTTENLVRLKFASFDPLAGAPAVPAVLQAPAENQLFLVQFVATPVQDMRDLIRNTGGAVERFLTDNTFVVRLPAENRAQLTGSPLVRWVGAYEVAYRISDEVRQHLLANDGLQRRYSLEVMRSEQQQSIATLISQLGGIVETTTPGQYRLEATLTPAQLLVIARRNEISFIDPWFGPGGADMNLLRQQGGATPLLENLGFLGQGVRGEVFDTGVITNHQQWNGQVPLINGSTAVDSHGMACYGIQFATGTGNVSATGFLPQREQGIFSYYNSTSQFAGGPTRLSLNTAATNPNGPYRSVYQTSSVGSARVTTYTTISAEVDDYLWRVDYLSCQSQSNSGNRDSRPQAWSKNIVSVGGMNLNESVSRTDDSWASGASIGPATDLRVKPDLAHSFGSVFTTYSTSTTGYGQFSGTSSATPVTAGHFGLLHQMWHQGVWAGKGGASSVFLSRPKSTTAKAMMINGAYRYPTTQGNLNRARIGWGMADLTYLYNTREKTFIVDETDVLTNAEVKSYTATVAAGEAELRATMVFADPAGSPAAAQARINDLSLRLTSPTGVIYWGNNGMIATAISGTGQNAGSNTTLPGGSANTVDTVEMVLVQNPEVGNWTVEVIASQIVQDARLESPAIDADFALVVTGATVAQTGGCYPNCDGSTTAPVLNVADFSCFLSRFAVGDTWANCDGSTAIPVLNVADFGCFLQSFAAGCP